MCISKHIFIITPLFRISQREIILNSVSTRQEILSHHPLLIFIRVITPLFRISQREIILNSVSTRQEILSHHPLLIFIRVITPLFRISQREILNISVSHIYCLLSASPVSSSSSAFSMSGPTEWTRYAMKRSRSSGRFRAYSTVASRKPSLSPIS